MWSRCAAACLSALVGKGGVVSIAAPVDWVQRASVSGGAADLGRRRERPRLGGGRRRPDALSELLEECESEGVRAREVAGDGGVALAAGRAAARRAAGGCSRRSSPRSGEVPFYSTVTGGLLDTAELEQRVLVSQHARTGPVRARPSAALLGSAPRAFVEVSPHPVLDGRRAGSRRRERRRARRVAASRQETAVLGTLGRDQGDARRFLCSLAEAWVAGVPVDWGAVTRRAGARRVQLPTYPFQRDAALAASPDR